MHKQFLPLLLAAFAVATPQDVSGLPSCAQPIVVSQIGATSCGADIACVCRDTSFIGNLRNLIATQCGEADAAAAETFHQTTCANYGVTLIAGSAAPSTTSGVTVTSTTILESNTMAASNMTMSSSVTGNPSMTATSIPSLMAGSCTVTTTTVCHTATVAPTTTGAKPSTWTGAADALSVNGVLAGAALLAAFL